jgi:hypothetical protein
MICVAHLRLTYVEPTIQYQNNFLSDVSVIFGTVFLGTMYATYDLSASRSELL